MTLIQYLLIPFTLFGIFLVGWLVKAMIELFKAGRELDEARNKYMRILTQKAGKDSEQWQKMIKCDTKEPHSHLVFGVEFGCEKGKQKQAKRGKKGKKN